MSQEPETATTSTQVEEANLFTITGPIVIRYFRASLTGEPQFSYKDAELDLSFNGDDIAREDTRPGEVVTVTLQIVADVFIRTFTLLVPKIRLFVGDQAPFDALGIETIDRSGAFVLPPGPTGVLDTYRSHQLHGVAEFVTF
jgi:hypothetical protein